MRCCFWWLMLVAGVQVAIADTTWVAGGEVSGAWNAADSPYMIQGYITVPTGESLTIGPGVVVNFTGPYWLAVDTAASFSAIGAEGDSIVFTTDTLANPAHWGGLRIYSAADTCRFHYCVIEYSGLFGGGGQSSQALNSTLEFRHTTLRYNGDSDEGGSFDLRFCRVTWSDCHLHDNWGSNGGIGFFRMTEARLENCLVENNGGDALGGAFDIWGNNDDTTAFYHCVLRNNGPLGGIPGGGAIGIEFSPLLLEDCELSGNSAGHGGAIFAYGHPLIMLRRCRLTGNSATLSGGAIYDGGDLQMEQCVVTHNQARHGGGVYTTGIYQNTSFVIDRCTFVDNAATEHGGGIYFEQSHSALVRSTVIAYSSDGEAVANPPGSAYFRNCALYANADGNFYGSSGSLGNVDRVNRNGDSCDISENIYLDLRFVDVEAGDYHLLEESPCIDAGFFDAPRDPDSTYADIGAFFFDQSVPVPPMRDAALPSVAALHAAYPNPFNAAAVISYDIAEAGTVSLKLFDILGREVETLTSGHHMPGRYQAVWQATGHAAGLYFAVLETHDGRLVQKLLYVR